MGVFRLVGNDTIKINGRLITDVPHGEVGKITFPTDVATLKTGKNSNAIFAANESGKQAQFELRLLRGSDDDKYLNQQFALQKSDFPKFVVMNGEVLKALGDGTGVTTSDSIVLTGGIFTKQPDMISNVEGDVEQAVALYTMQFALAPRVIA